MSGYWALQEAEFASDANGYTATRHQREISTGYFDQVCDAITGGLASTAAMSQSTEAGQLNLETGAPKVVVA